MGELLCPVVIGREREWRELERAVGRLAERAGTTVVVAGEAGVGKSRLVREAAADASRRGARVLTGRAIERDSPLPFRPLAEAVFSHLRAGGPPDAPALAPFRAILGRLVPEWRLPGDSPGEESLLVLGEAVLRLLSVLGEGPGCVLVLEDLHWADGETIEVLEYLADNLTAEPVLILASLRADGPSAARSCTRRLVARRAASLVELGRLTDDDVVAVASGCLGGSAVPQRAAEVLVAGSDGLPFLVEELVAAMVHDGQLRSTPDGWVIDGSQSPPVPATFAETVRRRLQTVAGGREVLGAAALLGRDFDWRLLGPMTGLDDVAVTECLRSAVDAQLLVVEPADAAPGFGFRHALTRSAIVAELLPPERVSLARRGVDALEATHPGLPGEWCELGAELAEQAGDADRAARLLLEAGRRAMGRGALAAAGSHLQRARRQVVADPWLEVEIDETRCELLAAAGDAEQVRELGDRLVPELARLGAPPARRARVSVWLARAAILAADWTTAHRHLDQAQALTAGDGAAGELDVLAAQVALGEGRLDDAVTSARAALAGVEATRRHEIAFEAYAVLGQRERQRDLAAARSAFDAMLALAEQHGSALWRVRALHELGTVDLLVGGPLDRLTEARQAALDIGALATAATVALQQGAWFVNHADAEGALDAGGSCATEAARLHLPLLTGLGLVIQAVGHALRGQRTEVEAAIARAVDVSDDHPEVRGVAALQARGLLAAVVEDRARMRAELDAGMELLRGTPVTAPNRGLWALVHALAGDDGDAAADEVEASGLTEYWLIRGWVGHARAISLGRRGRPAEAEEAFARADADLAPCAWYRHHARRLVAEAALADRWGDPARWLGEALAIFDVDGPPAVASACRSLLRQAGAPVARRRRPAADLPPALATTGVTAREAEVLSLLADGRSTKEIAARLYLSPKTVERHTANLAAKVGVQSRSELVAFAARHLGALP